MISDFKSIWTIIVKTSFVWLLAGLPGAAALLGPDGAAKDIHTHCAKHSKHFP